MKGIKYVAPRGSNGYAEAAKNYMLTINEIIPITWKQMVFDDSDWEISEKDKELNKLINKDIEWDTLLIHTTPEHWRQLYEEELPYGNIKENTKVIGQTVWETDKVPDEWIEYMNADFLDEIWVPTEWNKEVFEKDIKTPIRVVPHIFIPEILPNIRLDGLSDDDFVFYTIGQWHPRKGVEETIQAFCEAFTGNDKVALVVKTFSSDYSEGQKVVTRKRINTIMKNYPHHPKVIFASENCTREQILGLHNRCDCYISLCKAEGWGLGAFDSICYGNPVVITGFSGHLEFLGKDYPFLIDYDLIPVSGMDWIPWYKENQNWGNPKIQSAIEVMKFVFENRESVLNDTKILSKEIINKFYGKNIVKKYIDNEE